MLSTGTVFTVFRVFLDCRSGEVQESVSRKSWLLFRPEKLFCVGLVCIQVQNFTNNFENDTKKLSVDEAN